MEADAVAAAAAAAAAVAAVVVAAAAASGLVLRCLTVLEDCLMPVGFWVLFGV